MGSPVTINDKTNTYSATVDSGGNLHVTGTVTPSGTGDVNIKQVNGATVNVGPGASGTGTQRVTTSSDSTIGLVAGSAIIGKVAIDQTTPGATNLVQTPTPAANVIGQYKLTASAVVIGTGALVNGVTVKAKKTNAGTVFIGGATVNTTDDGTGNGFALTAGDSVSIPCSNLNVIYAIGTANDVLYFAGN